MVLWISLFSLLKLLPYLYFYFTIQPEMVKQFQKSQFLQQQRHNFNHGKAGLVHWDNVCLTQLFQRVKPNSCLTDLCWDFCISATMKFAGKQSTPQNFRGILDDTSANKREVSHWTAQSKFDISESKKTCDFVGSHYADLIGNKFN